ncbi:hypothetical protein ACFVAE_11325 [Microbacterium sp. NPDC057659]|uniref:hypothetical protein n=1 Tax=Microbacterium sp. NPDC057659 TaxID=3346198 RepID=UPI00366C4FA0
METTVDLPADRVTASRHATFRPVLILTSAFTVLSAAMIAYLAVTSATGIRFEPAIWVRCSLVLASAIVVLLFAVSAARGSRGAWVRLRIVSPIIVAAVIVIVSIPRFLPDWVRLEQAVCGLLLLPVAIIVNLRRTRALYPAKA